MTQAAGFPDIIRLSAQFFGLTEADLTGPGREFSVPRGMAMLACKTLMDAHRIDIAVWFGDRHPSSATGSMGRIQRMCGTSDKARWDYEDLTRQITLGQITTRARWSSPDIPGMRGARRYKVGDVKRLTAIFFKISRDAVEGVTRKRRFAWPRQVGMCLARHYTDASLPEIGRMFGGRDHTTVLHAFRAVPRTCAADRARAAEVSLLCGQIETAACITGTSEWAETMDVRHLPHHKRIAYLHQKHDKARADRLASIAANQAFEKLSATTAAPLSSPALRILSGPRVLLLRGPDFFAQAAE